MDVRAPTDERPGSVFPRDRGDETGAVAAAYARRSASASSPPAPWLRATRLVPRLHRLRPLALALCLLAAPTGLRAQEAASDPATSGPLFDALARMDSVLFDAAFASCDAAKAIAILTDDVEFYHDVTGLAVGDEVRGQFTSLTAHCPRRNGVSRVLVPGSLKVYPINHFGALQMGIHRFVSANGEPGSVAMFVHVWRQVDGEWKLARVLSYDHRPEAAVAPSSP